MNYYPFHIGDYAVHTRHLSLIEDLAYRRLLDLYYTREAALPVEPAQVARLLGMRDHVAEVEAVLGEFFALGPAGWTHARCDTEIAKASRAAETARANGSKGGRPPKASQQEAAVNPAETQRVTAGNPGETGSKAPNTQDPLPNPTTSLRSVDRAPRRSTDGYTDEFEAAWREYPSRAGQSKVEAFKAWKARIAAGDIPASMHEGVVRYAAFCEASRTEPRFVKHAATFFGPDRHFLNDWTPPAPQPGARRNAPFEGRHAAAARTIFGPSEPPRGDFIDA